MNTGIAHSMKIAADKSALDRHVVNLFSHKAVLAVLMMYCVEEFKGFSAEYIMEHCFVGEVSVRELPVDRDVPPDPDVKDLQMTEDVREDGGKMCNYSEAIWMQGIEKGMAQGMAQGKDIGAYETILDLVRKKLISIKVAAEQLGMTEKDFCEKAGIQKEQ